MTVGLAKPNILPGFAKPMARPSFKEESSASATAVATKPTELKNSAANNLKSVQNAAPFSNGARSNSIYPYVGARPSGSVNDYKRENIHYVNSGNYMPTPRSMDRMQMRMFDQRNCGQNNRYGNMNTPSDGMNTMALLNQLGGALGQITKEIAASRTQSSSSKSTQESVVIDASKKFAGSETVDALTELGSAKFSSEIKAGLATVASLTATKTEMSANLKEAIDLETGLLGTAEADLQQLDTTIGVKSTELRSVDAQITKFESDISGLEKMAASTTVPAMKATYEAQLAGLKASLATAQAKQEQLTSELDTLKGQKEDKTTEVTNLKDSIKLSSDQKKVIDGELASLKESKEKYTTKESKMEQSEQKDMQSLDGKLKKIAGKLKGEKNESKKQKLIEEYKENATKFNGIINNTSAQHNFQKVADEPNLVDGAALLAQSEV